MKPKFLGIGLATLLLAGCVSMPGGKPNPLLPWNWGKGDPAAKIEKFEARIETSKLGLIQISQELFEATMRELNAIPEPSPAIDRAKDYLGRGNSNLNHAVGPLLPERVREVAAMVAQRASSNPGEQAAGDKALAAIDRRSDKLVDALLESNVALGKAREAEGKALQRARLAEEKWDKMWFYIYLAIGGYVLLQILPLILRAFPVLAPISEMASWVAAPLVKASYNRLREGVVEVVKTAKAAGSVGVAAVEAMIDGPIDPHEQKILSRKVGK